MMTPSVRLGSAAASPSTVLAVEPTRAGPLQKRLYGRVFRRRQPGYGIRSGCGRLGRLVGRHETRCGAMTLAVAITMALRVDRAQHEFPRLSSRDAGSMDVYDRDPHSLRDAEGH